MSESLGAPIHTTTGYGQIDATFVDCTAIWVADYYSNPNPDYESIQLARRTLKLAHNFEQYKLLTPTVELISDIPGNDDDIEPNLGRQMLRVTTLLLPYVDKAYIRPIFELRQVAPSELQVEEMLIMRDLRAGGQAVHNSFASAMTPR